LSLLLALPGIMTVTPLSLPPFSRFHSSSPLAIPLLPHNDLSTSKSDLVPPMPHFSRMNPHPHLSTASLTNALRPRCRKGRRSRIAPRSSHGSGLRFSYEPLAGFESKSPISVTPRSLKCISSSTTSHRCRLFSFTTSS
jgi:hypothetical protein